MLLGGHYIRLLATLIRTTMLARSSHFFKSIKPTKEHILLVLPSTKKFVGFLQLLKLFSDIRIYHISMDLQLTIREADLPAKSGSSGLFLGQDVGFCFVGFYTLSPYLLFFFFARFFLHILCMVQLDLIF